MVIDSMDMFLEDYDMVQYDLPIMKQVHFLYTNHIIINRNKKYINTFKYLYINAYSFKYLMVVII